MTKKNQINMFEGGDDLPLFSGTPQQADESTFEKTDVYNQGTFYSCVACKDTGSIHLETGQFYCNCDAGRKLKETQS